VLNLTSSPDPHWQDQQTMLPLQLAQVRSWLLDEGSLTRSLIAASDGDFAVCRLHQSWQIPLPSERRILGMSTRQLGLVREVALLCHQQPWVFARSVIPAATLNGPLRHLRRLHQQSLGALIFRYPRLGRSQFQLALLAGDHPYIPRQLQQTEAAWARRSRFRLHNKSLLVSEVFLQPFCSWQQQTG
jgi:chorismate--pyruvate lyase